MIYILLITTFWPKNIIYNLNVLTPSDLQSAMKIMAKSTIYNLTSPPPCQFVRLSVCLIS